MFAFSFLIVMEESFLIVKISNCVWISPFIHLSSVQSSRVWLFVTPQTEARQASLSFTTSRACSNSHPLSQGCHPTISTCRPLLLLPSIFASIGVSFSESAFAIWWSMYWRFTFSFSPSNENSGLISFRIDWFGLSAVQGTLKSLLQHHSSKASILWHSAFFYCPALIFVHDYWKNHSFDCTHLCRQNNAFAV